MARASKTRVEKADMSVARSAGKARHHPATKVVGTLSEVGDQPPLRAIAAATMVAGALGRSPHLTGAGVRMLAAHQLATMVKSAIKHAVDRTRPEVVLDGDNYQSGAGKHDGSRFNSFPSGHTAGAVAVARAIGRDYPPIAVPVMVLATGIAIAQVPRGKHYVSDVIAGAIIGVLADAAVEAVVKFATTPRHPRRGVDPAGNLPTSEPAPAGFPPARE